MAFKDALESLWTASNGHYHHALQSLKALAGLNITNTTTETLASLDSQIGWSNPPEPPTMPFIPFTLDLGTGFSIAFALCLMPTAYLLGERLITGTFNQRGRLLFMWHAYDALTHLFIEGPFLYHCFFSYSTISPSHNRGPIFLNQKDRAYGATYSNWPTARLWQEYAKADHRWGGADSTVISIELLTVFLGGPAAVYICYLLWKISNQSIPARERGALRGRLWMTSIALATAELYGGFMTFCPEWLTGSSALDTSSWVYMLFYLLFFNILWVFAPIWVLWEAFRELKASFSKAETSSGSSSGSGPGKKR
ncbi:EBP-domain-containing protein [Aspergillus heteromorphus CBS 117.55]|uniref:EBP-domain-containing protein n=1 Tax=Aspergillus heteromorphus CBS 117.55 TaxID=1448321 RepID=A0A317VET9_9EURO|nr:EBP-domain-containing protein [Aspergillus heteromorphus CBS 117.55]PWY71711.1 EBP-domain-containing protein [Aspergillus heteromorphus CBS 117.55]